MFIGLIFHRNLTITTTWVKLFSVNVHPPNKNICQDICQMALNTRPFFVPALLETLLAYYVTEQTWVSLGCTRGEVKTHFSWLTCLARPCILFPQDLLKSSTEQMPHDTLMENSHMSIWDLQRNLESTSIVKRADNKSLHPGWQQRRKLQWRSQLAFAAVGHDLFRASWKMTDEDDVNYCSFFWLHNRLLYICKWITRNDSIKQKGGIWLVQLDPLSRCYKFYAIK